MDRYQKTMKRQNKGFVKVPLNELSLDTFIHIRFSGGQSLRASDCKICDVVIFEKNIRMFIHLVILR